MTHWIAVISREHARIAVCSHVLQVCHGKAAPLHRTKAGDEVFIYCPRERMGAGTMLKRIEFRCTFDDDRIYQIEQAPGFNPFRKDVTFDTGFEEMAIHDVARLELTTNPHWGMLARRGFFEISPQDTELLRAHGRVPA
ncbi:MAG: EVE domain-containing protein [Aphanocapsa feldmannii 277cV]|uniref:EVE domain-containing protein n=1 Tax=Aphanocapsa feldmannii 277cV TaxID=2507553 RepID=A0A524RKP5_9CHRO|nr:MAG: EVE domain-containing protein [Aphanocapsa feldmannii 277cV]